ncbi:7387_t:CDS:2, partial [Acaulospora colombiana]
MSHVNPAKKSQKEMTKAERRALQERQRAEKAARTGGATSKKPVQGSAPSVNVVPTSEIPSTPSANSEMGGVVKSIDTKQKDTQRKGSDNKQVALFSHLDIPKGANTNTAPKEIHPAALVLGLQFSEFKICGANARCIATLTAFQKVIQDYKTPDGTTLSRHLPTYLSPQITYLVNSRPMSVGMGNAIRHLKLEISTIDIEMSEDEAKQVLCEKIDNFIRDRITVADRVIVEYGLQKIQDGDDVSKVFLGAHAFMSNGALYSRVGTALVAMMAKEKNIPVIVCCETYKFTDKVQLDSFVMNEQGNPDEIVNISTTPSPKPGLLSGWLQKPDLKLLNLLYDLTPSKYITTVITEVGMIPCTSVPV